MVTAIIPAYNEEKNAAAAVRNTLKYADSVIFINDGSKDGTLEAVKGAGFRNVKIISYKQNMGKGYALIRGFQKFLKTRDGIAVTIDADGQHNPKQIPVVVSLIEKGFADVVIGSRYSRHRKHHPKARSFLNVFSSIGLLMASGAFFTDVASGFRGFSRKSLEAILPKLHIHDYAVELDVLKIVADSNLRVATVPITVSYSERKPNFGKLMNSYIGFYWRHKKDILRRMC